MIMCVCLSQRIASLCKLLGRGEDQLQIAMQNLSSSESMDFRALLLNESRKATEDEGGNQPPLGGKRGRCESDAESGFEDGGSSLTSKSMSDVTIGPLDMDNLQIYHLLMELQSVAVEWKSFRKVQNCSCAMPFEHFTKKVGRVLYLTCKHRRPLFLSLATYHVISMSVCVEKVYTVYCCLESMSCLFRFHFITFCLIREYQYILVLCSLIFLFPQIGNKVCLGCLLLSMQVM